MGDIEDQNAKIATLKEPLKKRNMPLLGGGRNDEEFNQFVNEWTDENYPLFTANVGDTGAMGMPLMRSNDRAYQDAADIGRCLVVIAWTFQGLFLFYMCKSIHQSHKKIMVEIADEENIEEPDVLIELCACFLHCCICTLSYSKGLRMGCSPACCGDAIVIPTLTMVIGAFFLVTSHDYKDVLPNCVGCAFVADFDEIFFNHLRWVVPTDNMILKNREHTGAVCFFLVIIPSLVSVAVVSISKSDTFRL